MKKTAMFSALLLFIHASCFCAASQTEEFGFGYFGYSRHATTVEPDKDGYEKEYSGTSSLFPTASVVSFDKGLYYKLDYEGTFAALATFLKFGNVSSDKAGVGPSGEAMYAGHMSGLLVPRTELGLCVPTELGFLGFGLNLDLASLGLSSSRDFSAKMVFPGTSFDVGAQVQYVYTLWQGFHINPSFTYNLMFTDRQTSAVDGAGMNFETGVTFKLLRFLSFFGTVGYDIRNFKDTDGDQDTQLRDFAMRFALAFHDIPSPFSSSVWGHN